MGFRTRKSIKIMPGVRMTVTARGMSVSAGVKGARVSVNSRGQATRTLSIPGTGISHVKTVQTGNRKSTKSKASSGGGGGARLTQPAAAPTRAPAPVKPGLFAPRWEKELFAAYNSRADAATYYRVASTFPEAAKPASMLEVLTAALPSGQDDRARTLLNWLHNQGYEPEADPFVSKYASRLSVSLAIAPGISAEAAVSRDSLGLLLAELEQAAGNLERATDVVEGLEPSTLAAVSLAELYAEQARWDEVVSLTDGLTNLDEPATYLLIQRGVALREKGFFEASREALKEALRPRSRPAELRQFASIERGKTYLAEGKKAMARKDFERVMAENSSFEGLADLLAAAS